MSPSLNSWSKYFQIKIPMLYIIYFPIFTPISYYYYLQFLLMVTHFYATSVRVNYLIQMSNGLKFHYVPHYVIIWGETLNNPTMIFSLISWFFNSMLH
jgi:hypothetical protein